ncbi:hypothetical protein [Pseudomonas sp. PS02302]|uniref:hypothetical protein n=1 Tax=Pseudomonas sp. PS02302 TaxID=2991428 RepID=UPI00249CBA5D|nr:hypothetical protein [Pseudomonas sp. PS02302]
MLSPIIEDQTTHLLKMKWDPKYKAEFEAFQADLIQAQAILKAHKEKLDIAKGVYHSTRPGDINKDSDPELQGLAALLDTLAFIKDPAQRLRMMKEWANS